MNKAAVGEKLAAGLSWLAGVVFVLLPVWTLLGTWAGSSFGHIDSWKLLPDLIVFAIAIPAIWLGLRHAETKRFLMESWLVKLYILYILLHISLGIWALKHETVNSSALIAGLVINLRFIGFFMVCYILAASSGFLIKNWIKLTLWPAAAVVLFGLAQRLILPLNFLSHFGYGSDTVAAYQTVDAGSGPPRLQSTLRGANPLGAYLNLIIPAWVGVFWHRKVLMVTGSAAALIVLVFSYSRSAEAGVLISAGLLIWWIIRKNHKLALIIISTMLLVGGSIGLYSQRNSSVVKENLLHTSSNSTSQKTSNSVRREALRDGLNDSYNQPLGRGPGTAGPASARNNHPARIAENYYVQLTQEVGIIGVAIFLAINIQVALALWKQRASLLPKILLTSLIGLTLINLVSHAWVDDTLSMMWWGLAGVACGTAILKRRNETST